MEGAQSPPEEDAFTVHGEMRPTLYHAQDNICNQTPFPPGRLTERLRRGGAGSPCFLRRILETWLALTPYRRRWSGFSRVSAIPR